MHADQLSIDEPLVRRLVTTQLPEHADLPLVRLESVGSSNALFRLGTELLVRLPTQPGGSATILKEARWSPYVAPALPVPVPYVVAVGEPGHGYPEHWSVVRWLPGDRGVVGGASTPQVAEDLAAVVRALRELPVTSEAASDPALRWYRGEALARIDDDVRQALAACRALPGLPLDLDAASAVWDDAVADPAPPVTESRWLHGDLLAENLLVCDGRIAAVLDLGGLAVGDPSVDLIVAWELFAARERTLFRALVGCDDDEWSRGRGWALAIALLTFPYYWTTMPQRCADRLAMARAVLEDAR